MTVSPTYRLAYENLRSRAASTFNGTYLTLGTALANQSLILKIVNNTDQDVLLSTDGTNDMDVCPAGGFTLYDASKEMPDHKNIGFGAGVRFYVKAAAGSGTVYLVTLHL